MLGILHSRRRYCLGSWIASHCTPRTPSQADLSSFFQQARHRQPGTMVKVGDKIPSATLKTMGNSGMQDITSEELTTGKKVVIFAVPGAFTPTCSKSHAPGFIKHAADLKAKGVDTIACVSVNDPFVMDAWAKDLAAGSAILFLADGNGEFTKAMDLQMDGSGFGLGSRSQRYAAVIDNGVITKLEVEAGNGLTCSAADNILTLL